MAPMHNLGNNRSANGTIEYLNGDTFCGDLQGQVLLTNYSIGDDVTRLQLSSNGLSVIDAESLVGGFDDPLPITEDPDGNLYVGEFGGNLITVLEPLGTGCWSNEDPLPVATLDAGGAALGGKIYVVAGKNGAGTFSTTRIYNPATGAWTTGPNLPGPAVENPAVTTANGLLYAFGGSTQPFSGAVTNAAVYDPSTNQWTPLAAMPVARGGATAQAIGNLIYVVGGMDTDGASLDTVSVFNINTGTWSSVASMSTRRDNPGSAVLNGDLYIFGGRTRNADGTIVANTLNTVEMFDPGTGTWTSRAPMPTGRRTMVVGVLNGRALVIGGERKVDGTAFSENEEYDPDTNTWRTLKPLPTARHGAVAGVVNGVVYVIGGATSASAGTAVTNNEAFSFQS
jgi:N-acetylneuraminic acid mutarotase